MPRWNLPEEIQKMSESETACEYCGISYLLLTKYEQLQSQVNEMQIERDKLREYIQERDQIRSDLIKLTTENQNLTLENGLFQEKATQLQTMRSDMAVQIESLELENAHLKSKLSNEQVTVKQLKSTILSKHAENTLKVNQLQCNLNNIKGELKSIQAEVQSL
jgi:regulator of replication initiation timing